MIPQMLLEPLVENSIYHGEDETDRLCHINVSIGKCDNLLKIIVSDDGPGMDIERLEEVRSFSYSGGRNGIGIKNIHSRLELLYPENDFSMQIDSTVDIGTTISITLPIRRENGEEQDSYSR